ncbi:MAG: S8 family serine peptidase [Piscinibacter sp.]
MRAHRVDLAHPAGLPLADAYLPWGRVTGFRDAGRPGQGGDWLWLLLELGVPAQDFAGLVRVTAREHLRVPGHYLCPPRGLEGSVYCTAACSRHFLDVLTGFAAGGAWAEVLAAIRRFEIGFVAPQPPDPDAGPEVVAAHGLAPAAVVVGVVDDGIAFANERFRSRAANGEATTRLLAFWDQSRGGVAGGPWTHGPVHDRERLQGALRAAGAAGRFDEQEAYRSLDYREVRHRVTHGSHVMDLACGADPGDPPAPPIVAVQLPVTAIADTSCASTTVYMLDAIRFVLAAADAVALPGRTCPVVVNLSIGNIAGPHDGSSIFEQALDAMVAARDDCHMVLAAGNSYLSRCHAWTTVGPDGEAPLDWQIQPGDGTPSYLELWVGRGDGANEGVADVSAVSLAVTPPGGPTVTVSPGQGQVLRIDGAPVAMISWQQQVANGRRAMALIAVAPTAANTGWPRPAPCGAWHVALHNAGRVELECRAYVQRDDAPLGHPTQGRQSRLEDADYHRFDRRGGTQLRDSRSAYVRRSGTLNGLASGAWVHVAGGALRDRDDRVEPARYSSVPLPDERDGGGGLRPLVITEDSPLLHGVLAAGTASGSRVALSGTSMAAPQLTRLIADSLSHRDAAPPAWQTALDHQDQPVPLAPVAAAQAERARRRRGDA